MKTINPFLAVITLFLMLNTIVKGQSYIFLDEPFKANSELMHAKRKGFSSVGKYQFGPYRIISGKGGWTTTKEKSGFISGDSRMQSKTKKSFVFTSHENDTVIANISVTSVVEINEHYRFFFRTLTNWSDKEITENQETFIVTFTTTQDTGAWNLVLVCPERNEIRGEITEDMVSLFQGTLSNSQTVIVIEPDFKFEDGRPASFLKPIEGYKFILNGQTVAAVQVYPINKMVTWLRKDIPEKLKTILAAGAAAMMVRSF